MKFIRDWQGGRVLSMAFAAVFGLAAAVGLAACDGDIPDDAGGGGMQQQPGQAPGQ